MTRAVTGAEIRARRLERRISRRQAALILGVAKATLASWENGVYRIPEQRFAFLRSGLRRLAAAPPDQKRRRSDRRPAPSSWPQDQLRQRRLACGLTVASMAHNLNIHRTTLYLYETGRSRVSQSLMEDIERLLCDAGRA